MGENVETGSQTGCHYPILPRRQIVLFKKHKQNNQPLTLKDVCAVQSRKAKKIESKLVWFENNLLTKK